MLDGGSASNGLGAEVGAVALLGGAGDDAAVELARWGAGLEGGGVQAGGGLMGVLLDLGGHDDGVVGAGVDADRAGVGKAGVLRVR